MSRGHPIVNRKIRWHLSLAKPIVTLSVGVLLPVLLSTATGIVAIVIGESSVTLILGILTVSFMAAAIGGAVIVYVLLGRRARIARLQSDLLTNVTHDLRTPLSVIRVWAQTLQSQEEPDRRLLEESLATIVRETEWLEDMIDRVLMWRSAARDRDTLEMRRAPLGPAVEEALQRFRRMVNPGEVELSLSGGSALEVEHDPQAIAQAVLNLLINAFKYTPADRRITLGLRDENGSVVVTVEDNGIGIPAAEVARIFEPFYRVRPGAAKVTGAGLGLAIVHHVVKAHGGRIVVESREGKGSCFSLYLPAARPAGVV